MAVTLRSIGDGVVRTNSIDRVNYLNLMAKRLTGWTNEAAHAQPVEVVFRIVHHESRRPVRSPVAQCLSEDRPVSLQPSTVLISRDGSEHSVKDSVSPVRDDSGKTVGVVLVF